EAGCCYLEPQRLVTTEVVLRGPIYKEVWISVGFDALANASPAQVREDIKRALQRFLSPLPDAEAEADAEPSGPFAQPTSTDTGEGWPLRKPVVALELLAVASRVPGVRLVNQVLLAMGDGSPASQVPMVGLELPRIAGISVAIGDPVDLDQLRGQQPPPTTPTGAVKPVPIIPEECR